MTKKRFVNKGKDIFQYGEWWCSANGEHCADVIATAINELIEENEELYEEKERLRKILEYSKIDCKHLVSYEEGDYCIKTDKWFFDFEGYEDYCPTCEYYERR